MTNDRWKAGLPVLALLAGLGVICPLLIAPYIPLVDPDEGLHASIAQQMVESGDWIVPRQLDEPFLDKPILYFWAIAASLKDFRHVGSGGPTAGPVVRHVWHADHGGRGMADSRPPHRA